MTARKPLYALGLASITTMLLVGVGGPVGAVETCAPTPQSQTCFTRSSDTVIVEQPVVGTTTDIETFQTRVIVRTGDTTTYDQTVDAASDSTAAVDATEAAKATATDEGLEITGVETSTPERTLSNSAEEEVTTLDREELSNQTEVSIGPATVQVGPDRSESVFVPAGATLVNINTRTTRYVDVTTNTTNTYLTTATITIVAVAPTTTTAPTASTTTTAPAAVSPASTDTSTGELARTGSSNGPWTAAGITLVLAGAACLHLSRRTARRQAA